MFEAACWPQSIWELIAKDCLQVHRLRTVCNVARDLAALESVCKSSVGCASSVWQSVGDHGKYSNLPKSGKLTVKQVKQYLPDEAQTADTVLERVIKLPSDEVAAFIQAQCKKYATMVNKTKAKQECKLSDADVQPLGHRLKRNIYIASAPVRLYYKQDLIDLANKKWGSLEGLLTRQHKAEQAAGKRKSTKRAKWEASDEGKAEMARQAREAERLAALDAAAPARRQALIASLAVHGLQLEHHFRLCKDYLRRGIGDPDDIAATAHSLTWLYANTDVRGRMSREHDSEGVSPLDPYWHGVGWGQDEEQAEYEEPLTLDGMNCASATARREAMHKWYQEHQSDAGQLQSVPPGLLQIVGHVA